MTTRTCPTSTTRPSTAGCGAAERLDGAARIRAYARLSVDLDRAAPDVVYATDESRALFSARIGCQVYQPLYGVDMATLCIRPGS